ncbi:site-specific integrase [Natrinema pellirubrum]|uniref:hypothetical protein n=1 Tax=Natrinema pellirubrum TaxID=69525 RepID=UPI00022DA6D2|nr:hypothetical protein [Natrinema pellirubrum]
MRIKEMLDYEQAEPVQIYLERYEYASLPHVTIALLWHTMMRLGATRALDVGDYSPEEQYLTVEHRPVTGTPVKKETQGERHVALSGELCLLLDDRDQHPDVTDEYGRELLLTTPYGRSSKSNRSDDTTISTRDRAPSSRSVHTTAIRRPVRPPTPTNCRSARRT